MKRYTLNFVLMLLLVIICSYVNYKTYVKEINDITSLIVSNVENYYPDVSSEEIVKIISSSNNNTNTLKTYGFTENDISYIKKINTVYYKNMFINVGIFSMFGIILGVIYFFKKRKLKKEVKNITNYLKKINEGIYNLEIIDNIEGDLSILKNEIYTTTVHLKEMYSKEYDDKIKIKNNLANISHQIKTPLTGIVLMIDTLLEENVSKEKQMEYLNDIRNQIENINFLILTLLKLSKLDASIVKFEKNNIVVKELVEDVLKNTDILQKYKNIKIHVNGKENISFIGDYKWECEAFTNILKNAIEYSHENGGIYINYYDNGICICIDIIDFGEEIPKKELPYIFDRFYTKNNNSNNFGIGLSLAKEIVEKDNGMLKAKSTSEKTIFTLKYYK